MIEPYRMVFKFGGSVLQVAVTQKEGERIIAELKEQLDAQVVSRLVADHSRSADGSNLHSPH